MKKMDRKSFIKKAALGATASAITLTGCKEVISNPGASSKETDYSKKYKWNMVTTWPPNFPILGEGCNKFAEWVDQMSGGRLKIRVYGGGELIPALEAFDAVSSGTAQIGHGSAYYWAGKIPAAQFFASVPFGMNAQQVNAWIQSGGGMELWRELYAPFNLIPFLAGNTNAQMGGWFNKEINSLDDIKGLKMRIPGLGGRVIERAGGSAILSAGGEIYTNLERGVIDATEWIGPFHDYKMGFHEIAKYYYSPGWHEAGTALEVFINSGIYQSLPYDLQAILEAACARLNLYMMTELEVKNAEYLAIMREEGVDIRTFPTEVLDALKALTAEVIQEMTDKDPKSAKVYASFKAFKAMDKDWSNLTERVFYNAIS
ncbi:MAG: TRAP transporter substrate-binding protein [Saprospiraceae bacterium]|nr:TRAP transporter substrate-binding protein [Saprospiraceae bacterium]